MDTPSLAQQILSSNNPEKEVNRLLALIAQLHKENFKLKSKLNPIIKKRIKSVCLNQN